MIQADIFKAFEACKLIDISQPIARESSCFPGDTPFSYQVTETVEENGIANVSAFTMSPHVCTHADAPSHLSGSIRAHSVPFTPLVDGQSILLESIGQLPLKPYIGPVTVIDIAPFSGAISSELFDQFMDSAHLLQKRVLFKTREQGSFEDSHRSYACFTTELVDKLCARGVELLGIDTPSVDNFDAKILAVHNRLLMNKMYWLENLDLTLVESGQYCLVALPLKFMELEASPVRAVLLSFDKMTNGPG